VEFYSLLLLLIVGISYLICTGDFIGEGKSQKLGNIWLVIKTLLTLIITKKNPAFRAGALQIRIDNFSIP
jgi:hypothetical protein